jgi:hypothetical protein
VLIVTLIALFQHPATQRDWQADHARVPRVDFYSNIVHISGVRNITYRSTTDYDVAYYDASYNLNEVQHAWFFVEDLSSVRALAHTMLSFDFADGRHLVLSVEARKEKGESYSPWGGLVRKYELLYVIADEHDAIRLRTIYRNDTVRMYPLNITAEHAQSLLRGILVHADAINEHPEFYNTLTSTCTTNIVEHANSVTPGRIPWSLRVFLPGYSDKYAYDLGLLNTTLSYADAREAYRIEEAARVCGDCAEFSEKIRDVARNAQQQSHSLPFLQNPIRTG